MMSVKHIGADGREAVLPATSVRFTPALSSQDGKTGAPATLWLKHGEADDQPITGGRAFVMNDTGATVARYDLSPVFARR